MLSFYQLISKRTNEVNEQNPDRRSEAVGLIKVKQTESTHSYLHDAHDCPAIIRKVLYATNYIGGVEEGLRMSGEEHEQAHHRHGRPVDQSDDGRPHEEIPQEALDRPRHVDHPRTTTYTSCVMRDGGVEEA